MYPEFTSASTDRMLAFLPAFERGDFASADAYYLSTGKYLLEVIRFCNEVYHSGFFFPFDWVAWKKQEGRTAFNPENLAQADLLTIRKMLTACVRQDRFYGGFLPRVCSSGLIKDILVRLKQIQTESIENI